MSYDFKEVEERLKEVFKKIFYLEDLQKSKKPKFYCLEMFPYPSGRLHMGHVRNYTIGDAIARFKRMSGFEVFYPMGYDSFGLPAENAAIKQGIHPKKWTEDCIENMKTQQIAMGNSYGWSHEIATHRPQYYKWNQYFFLKFFEKGIAYRKKAPVNYCPLCKTVLANEQVVDGKCWRCESKVETKFLEQWFFRISDYAERLLEGLNKIDWPERIKEMQRNWIGKSEGTLISFELEKSIENTKSLEIFTTRIDTLFGVTFIAIAPEHPLTLQLAKEKKMEKKVKEFVDRVIISERFERTSKEKSKEGIFLNTYAIHPFTKEKIPIYTAGFVLPDYGTGIIMGVPAHDARDYEFAIQHGLKIKRVIKSKEKSKDKECKEKKEDDKNKGAFEVFEEYGILGNSGKFSGLDSEKAIVEITKELEKKGVGKKACSYKIRDWLISRQRYWGTPIPVVYCKNCGIVALNEKDLPLLLPEKIKFDRGNPLTTNKEWLHTKCPKCNGNSKRETDTMDTFVDSSWYFLRYVDNKNDKMPFDEEKIKKWLPVDFYIGGAEHATMHLIYARFFTKVLYDLGLVAFDEPFLKLVNQGIVTLGGEAMSKSKGNIVDPFDVIPQYGCDALRLALLFKAMPEKDLEWNDEEIKVMKKFLDKIDEVLKFYIRNYAQNKNIWSKNSKSNEKEGKGNEKGERDDYILAKLNALIRDYQKNMEELRFPYAIHELMEFVKRLIKYKEKISQSVLRSCLQNLSLLLNPLAPYISEHVWSEIGNEGYSSLAEMPSANEALIKNEFLVEDEYISNLIADTNEIKSILNKKFEKIIVVIADNWKFDVAKTIKDCNTFNEAINALKNSEYSSKIEELKVLINSMLKFSKFVLDADKEHRIVYRNKEEIENEFKVNVLVMHEKEAIEYIKYKDKAKKALPMKPVIILE